MPSPDRGDFVLSFVKTFKALQETVTRTLAPYGVHPGQNMMLSALADQDGRTPGELSERLGITGPTVVKAAQRMEAAGLVAALTAEQRHTLLAALDTVFHTLQAEPHGDPEPHR